MQTQLLRYSLSDRSATEEVISEKLIAVLLLCIFCLPAPIFLYLLPSQFPIKVCCLIEDCFVVRDEQTQCSLSFSSDVLPSHGYLSKKYTKQKEETKE